MEITFIKQKPLIIPALVALALFVFFMVSSTIRPYGYFIDELYFISCSKHLAWGYIDQPPLSIVLLAMIRLIPGDGLWIVRLLPAISISATVFISGLLVKKIGGGIVSILLTTLSVAFLPVFLIFGSFYSMNAYEPLIWVLIVYYALDMVQHDKPKNWLIIGLLMGIGLQMKHTIVMYGLALMIGLLFTPNRKFLWNKWAIWGGLICFAVILPNIIWQFVHGFPSIELYKNSFTNKNINKSIPGVLSDQLLFNNPLLFPVWFAGLFALMLPEFKKYRFIFWTYAVLLLIIVYGRSSRPDRIAAIYPILIAIGSVSMEKFFKPKILRPVQAILITIILAGGLLLAPAFAPVLSPEKLKGYLKNMGLQFNIEAGKIGEPIPQWLADRFGWEEMAMEVGLVYQALPLSEKQNAVIISTNYGEAGALELYGPKYGLPPVYATHNSFHSWGPPSDSVKTFIGVYVNYNDVVDKFERVEEVQVVNCPICTQPQRKVPVYILHNPGFSMEKEWPNFKIFQ